MVARRVRGTFRTAKRCHVVNLRPEGPKRLGELVFLPFAVTIDEHPDRLAQLSVFERLAPCRPTRQIGGCFIDELGPSFQDEHAALALRAVEYLADLSVSQVEVVDHLGELLEETNAQTSLWSAGSLVELGSCQLVIALFITFL